MDTPSFCSLPIECRQHILSSLSDFDTLRAAILSHSSLYTAFLNNRRAIIKNVLINFISPELLPEALFAFEASHVEAAKDPWTREKVLAIWNRFRKNELPPNSPWEISNGLAIQEFHRHVFFFTDDFISTALSIAPLKTTEESTPPLSPSEWRRVARSFYRFEIYRHLFKQRDYRGQIRTGEAKESPDFKPAEQWDVYFRYHAAWEIEQLACVSEYLYRKLSVPFNEIAAHTVEWARRDVPYLDNEVWETDDTSPKLNSLSHGLCFLRHVVTAQTYEERYILLNPKLGLMYYFLPDSLEMLQYFNRDDGGENDDSEDDSDSDESDNDQGNNGNDDNDNNSNYGDENEKDKNESKSHLLGDCDPNGSSTCLRVPLADEPNTGPAEAWRWAHLKFEFPFIFYNIEMRELRRWGYVMWDHERLIEGGLFDSPWQEPDDIDEDEIRRREDVMDKSIEKRYLLYAKGATGWWEEGDESKLVWESWGELSDDTVEMWYLSRRRS